jgi:hypothetical protein
MELSNWVALRGSADVAKNVRGALQAIDKNEELIKMTLAVLFLGCLFLAEKFIHFGLEAGYIFLLWQTSIPRKNLPSFSV